MLRDWLRVVLSVSRALVAVVIVTWPTVARFSRRGCLLPRQRDESVVLTERTSLGKLQWKQHAVHAALPGRLHLPFLCGHALWWRSSSREVVWRLSASSRMPVLLTLLLLTRNAASHGPPSSRPALRLRGGGSPSIVRTVAAVEEVQPRLSAAAVARGEAASLQPSHAPPPRWPAGSGLVVALLYLVALVNGLARRTLSCAAPVLERDGLFTKAELEGVYMVRIRVRIRVRVAVQA